MKIYIAYKFTNVEDRQILKNEILNLSALLEKKGHTTFVLGRDVQNWSNTSYPIHHKFKHITKNINLADCVMAYVNSAAFSKGLAFELVFAKLTGKKIYVVCEEKFLTPLLRFFASKVIIYSDLTNLESALNARI